MDNRQLQPMYLLQCHKSQPCLYLDYIHQQPKEILQNLPNWSWNVHFSNQHDCERHHHHSFNSIASGGKYSANQPLAFTVIGIAKAKQDSFFGEKECATSSITEIVIQVTDAFQSTANYCWKLKFNLALSNQLTTIPDFFCCKHQRHTNRHSELLSKNGELQCHHPFEIQNHRQYHLKYFQIELRYAFFTRIFTFIHNGKYTTNNNTD